ncbi:bromodomain-containing protein 4-like [Helicoverpa zea]|nr:bromodomain-containing protein 4-like [Helicoverpa zea]
MPDAGLDPDILDILGIDPSAAVEYGPNINDELASRLSYLVTSGLDKDIRKELLQKYLVPINCKHLSAPQLNPEIKAATPEYVQKRDKSIEMNQKEIAAAITCVGQIITTQINHSCRDNELLKQLMDVGRILCDVQYLQSSARRNHALYSLKKDLREQLRNSKIDEFLFGQNLSETLKAAKAVSKTSSDLKADTAKKPRPSKNLNRKSGPGNRRAAPGPPRQQPPAPARATTSYQPPPPPPTTRAPYSSASSYRPRQTRRR